MQKAISCFIEQFNRCRLGVSDFYVIRRIFLILFAFVFLHVPILQVFALDIGDQTIYVTGSSNPAEVEFEGASGEPRSNSGAVYFSSDPFDGVTIPPSVQAQVVSADAESDYELTIEGYAWNTLWGWISLGCRDGENRGVPCEGDFGVDIDVSNNATSGVAVGSVWNEYLGEIIFDRDRWTPFIGCTANCPPAYNAVNFNFTEEDLVVNPTHLTLAPLQFKGFAWNDRVGFLYFEGTLFEIPNFVGLVCGNGVTDAGETCDDGDMSNLNHCLNSCVVNTCGDGYRDGAGMDQIWGNGDDEWCDDGNVVNGDGCSATCQNEGPAVCGDSYTQFPETCDEGPNTDRAGDQIDDKECVIDSVAGVMCQLNQCGDGYLNFATEQCDDDNLNNGDGCSSTCQKESSQCGNGIRQGTEQCDNGASNSNSGRCLKTCQLNVCGDGFIDTLREQCDDGNVLNGDFCSSTCRLSGEIRPPVIGDGITDPGEECDDGVLYPTTLACDGSPMLDGCSATGEIEGACGDGVLNRYAEQCDDGNFANGDGCDYMCRDEVAGQVCGNKAIERTTRADGVDEQCDDGNLTNNDGCSRTCVIECAYCGDEIINGTEQCDDGNDEDTDTCKNNCRFGKYAICGDGIVGLGETCDDGNRNSGDACNNKCSTNIDRDFFPVPCGENLVEFVNSRFRSVFVPQYIYNVRCGNGVLDRAELCEDGNTTSGDGCSATCVDETVGASCGNAVIEPTETCDDGGNVSGDGCSEICILEPAIMHYDTTLGCVETFDLIESVCGVDNHVQGLCTTESSCGDGVWDEGEECDYREIGDPYREYCSSSCTYEYDDVGVCGDGVRRPGEECDDGNFVSGDGCFQCESELSVPGTCGDGAWSLGEECDSSYALMSTYIDSSKARCAECDVVPRLAVCGADGDRLTFRGNPFLDRGEECDDGLEDNGTSTSNCTTQCTLKEEVEQITCFPEILLEKEYSALFGDVYAITVDPNCLEEEPVDEDWMVSIGVDVDNFTYESTVDCDQTVLHTTDAEIGLSSSADTSICTFAQPMQKPFVEPEKYDPAIAWPQIGSLYSYAPTGYTSPLDPDNRFVLNEVKVTVLNSTGDTLFSDFAPVEQELTFTPKVEAEKATNADLAVRSSVGGSAWKKYFDFAYNQTMVLRSQLQRNSTVTATSALYTLSVDTPYQFKFDTDRSTLIESVDSSVHTFNGNGYNSSGKLTNVTLGFGGTPPRILGFFNVASAIVDPQNEALNLEITYEYGGRTVKYLADRLPDTESLKLYEQEVRIVGPVDSNKLLGASSGIAKVGALGESVQRGEILRNISTIIEDDSYLTRERATIQFTQPNTSDRVSITTGDYAHELVDATDLYYFKGDVVFSGEQNSNTKRSIVTYGGNIYVNANVAQNLSAAENSTFEIVALRDENGYGGNIFVGPDVTFINAYLYADGSIFPYDGISMDGSVPDWQELADGGYLDNQIVFKGTLNSNNTIGGAEDQDDTSSTYYYRGDGIITTDFNLAKIYDLNYFRRHGLEPARTDDVGNPDDCNGDGTLQIDADDFDEDVCIDGAGDSDLQPIGQRYSGALPSDNYPVYFYLSVKRGSSVLHAN